MSTEYLFETIPFAGEASEYEQESPGQELGENGEYEGEDEYGRVRLFPGRRRPARPIRPKRRVRFRRVPRPVVASSDWLAVPDEPIGVFDASQDQQADDSGTTFPAAPNSSEPPSDAGDADDAPAGELGEPCTCGPACRCAACRGGAQSGHDWARAREFETLTPEAGTLFETLEFESGGPAAGAARAAASCATSFVDCPPRGTAGVVLDNFKFDQSALDPTRHVPLLNDVARRILASQATSNPIHSLLVAGHTDAVGDDNYNFALARRRAETVARELCRTIERMRPGGTRGLSLRLTSCGERQTLARPEASRRVEIFLPTTPLHPRRCPPGVRERLTLHLKILVPPTRFTIEQMLNAMRQVYRPAGILVEVGSRERLRLPTLEDVDLFCPGKPTQTCCPFPCATNNLNPEHLALFRHRRGVGAKDLAVYFVRSTVPGLNGCCAHPPGRQGVIVAATASQWTLAHEIGHVLGLPHVNNNDRLMTGNGTNNITKPPPDLIASEVTTMLRSSFTVPC